MQPSPNTVVAYASGCHDLHLLDPLDESRFGDFDLGVWRLGLVRGASKRKLTTERSDWTRKSKLLNEIRDNAMDCVIGSLVWSSPGTVGTVVRVLSWVACRDSS